ncbi:Small ribosomal subunit protein eS27w [Orobanche minor]
MVLPNDIDMLHPPSELKARKHKLKRLVPTPRWLIQIKWDRT